MIKDSGDRREFSTGAVRDMGNKGRCDLMPLRVAARVRSLTGRIDTFLYDLGCFLETKKSEFLYMALDEFGKEAYSTDVETMLLEASIHYEEGAEKYGENNWQKGLPVNCYVDSAVRHYLKWCRGDEDEPHARAVVWNLMCCAWEVDHHNYENEDTEN